MRQLPVRHDALGQAPALQGGVVEVGEVVVVEVVGMVNDVEGVGGASGVGLLVESDGAVDVAMEDEAPLYVAPLLVEL